MTLAPPPLIAPVLEPPPANSRDRRAGHLAPRPLHPEVLRALALGLPGVEAPIVAAWELGQLLAAGTMAPLTVLRGCPACHLRSLARVAGAWRCLDCGKVAR